MGYLGVMDADTQLSSFLLEIPFFIWTESCDFTKAFLSQLEIGLL